MLWLLSGGKWKVPFGDKNLQKDLFYRKGEMPMYITFDDVLQLIVLFVAIIDNHIQLALLIVTVVALLRKIKRQKDEKK